MPAWLDDSELDVYEMRVYIRIARRGECYEGAGAMAQSIGISRDKCIKARKSLVEKGYILKTIINNKNDCVFTINDNLIITEKPSKNRRKPTGSLKLLVAENYHPSSSQLPPLVAEIDPKDTPLKDTPLRKAKNLKYQMPDDWVPDDFDGCCDFAEKLGMSIKAFDVEITNMRDYFLERPNDKRAGWDRTFKKWLQTAVNGFDNKKTSKGN